MEPGEPPANRSPIPKREIYSGWFTEWYEWGKNGPDVCRKTTNALAK
jgi:hypothetical protein